MAIGDSGPVQPSRRTSLPINTHEQSPAETGRLGTDDAFAEKPDEADVGGRAWVDGFAMTEADGPPSTFASALDALPTESFDECARTDTAGRSFESEVGDEETFDDCLVPSFDAPPKRRLHHEQDQEISWSIDRNASGHQLHQLPVPRPQTVAVPIAVWVGGHLIEDRRKQPPALGPAGVSRRTTFTRRCEYHGFCDPSDPLGCGGELCGKKPHSRIE